MKRPDKSRRAFSLTRLVIRLVILFLISSCFRFFSLQLPLNPASSYSDLEYLRSFIRMDRNVVTSAPLAPFTINETNSNVDQFQEKFSLVEVNGRADGHLARPPRNLSPAAEGDASSISIARQTRASSNFF